MQRILAKYVGDNPNSVRLNWCRCEQVLGGNLVESMTSVKRWYPEDQEFGSYTVQPGDHMIGTLGWYEDESDHIQRC